MSNVGKRKAFSIGAEKYGVNAFSQNEIEHFECCDEDIISNGELSEEYIVALVNEQKQLYCSLQIWRKNKTNQGLQLQMRKRFEHFFCHRKHRRTCCGPVDKNSG
ncbi:hypothetical protein AVEN_269900-1 [Araneus ventricosus]|uniref:Uncharacterized protein n=1 Tax=Araneus ventricosus TaxID=182803 RepID=A0A4Y2IDH8_ARAVE|nr:hypothetical protein AVEN_269900-1 [Araneus ventricosus]